MSQHDAELMPQAGPALALVGPKPSEALEPPRGGRRGRRDLGFVFGLAWIGAIVAASALADLLPLAAPGAISAKYGLAPLQTLDHPLGTDQLGRDLLARSVYGARISLSVAIGATALGLVVGTALGIVAGFFRGITDTVIDVITNTMMAFPPLIFLIALVAALRPSATTLIVGLAVVGIPTFARIARANTIAFAQREFVIAARALGASNFRIVTRELLGNVLLPVTSFALVIMAVLVVAEGSLSFLGLGVPPPTPSWGGMISQGRERLEQTPHLVMIPGAFFFLTIFSLNRIADRARSRFGRESAL